MKARKITVILFILVHVLFLFGCEGQYTRKETEKELISVHYGHSIKATMKFPEGQSIEDNIYLDLIREELGIEIIYDWVCANSEYEQKIDLCIASNTLPDIMSVNERQFRKMLANGQIQSMSNAYEEYASDMLKSIVSSGEIMDTVMEQGEMMALPIPHVDDQINIMWIRQDWLENLGLAYPVTVEELEAVARAFVTNDPDGNGLNDTVGIIGPYNSSSITGLGGNQWGLDPIFSVYGSFPGTWLVREDGTIYYGSLTEETKYALERLASMYQEGILDSELLLRGDSLRAVLEGTAGIFFGPWWSGYSMVDGIMSGEMDWTAHCVPLAEDGKYYNKMSAPCDNYIVVSKNCDYPQAAIQIINLLLRDEAKWVDQGFNSMVSISSVYPLFTVYDNADEIAVSFDILDKWLRDEITMEEIDFTKHKLLENDMEMLKVLKKEPLDDFSIQYWDLEHPEAASNMGRLYSFMVGQRAISTEGYEPVVSAYYGYTETMMKKWKSLKEAEVEMFSRIIMGDAGIEEFDEFVRTWHSMGGEDIIKEIEAALNE